MRVRILLWADTEGSEAEPLADSDKDVRLGSFSLIISHPPCVLEFIGTLIDENAPNPRLQPGERSKVALVPAGLSLLRADGPVIRVTFDCTCREEWAHRFSGGGIHLSLHFNA